MHCDAQCGAHDVFGGSAWTHVLELGCQFEVEHFPTVQHGRGMRACLVLTCCWTHFGQPARYDMEAIADALLLLLQAARLQRRTN